MPGAKPKADMAVLDKELQDLVAELQPSPEERQRQQVLPRHWLCSFTVFRISDSHLAKDTCMPAEQLVIWSCTLSDVLCSS